MAAAIIREMANFDRKETLECIATSFQINLEAECSRLKLVDEGRIPEVNVIFDGADEIHHDTMTSKISSGTPEGNNADVGPLRLNLYDYVV
jgi:ribose 5-phosphate isomerase